MTTARKSVLLVEDEDNIALALQFLIERAGFDLTRVATGPEALDFLSRECPDLVVLDVMLPGCSGYDVLQTIRQSDRLSRIKVLMMTAAGREMNERKSQALGADALFAKPFDTRALTDEIQALLGEGGDAR